MYLVWIREKQCPMRISKIFKINDAPTITTPPSEKYTLSWVFLICYSAPSPWNLDSAVLIPSAFIAGQRSLGSHNDNFVSLFRQFFPIFNSIVLSKISLKCDRKIISQLDRCLYLTIYLIIKCPWQKERLWSRILSDVKFVVFLWPGINKINVDHGVRHNQYLWQPGNFFLCSTNSSWSC